MYRAGKFAKVRLISGRMLSAARELTTGEKHCFRFWHFTGGNRNEILNVSRAGVGGKEELLWSITGDDTIANEWASGSVNIPIQENTSQVCGYVWNRYFSLSLEFAF